MEVQNYVDGLLNIPGMKFVPEEHHLLQFYLSRKINGEPLPWNGIRDFDVYGEQGPWELIHGQTSSEPAYAFAISKNLGPHMKKRTCKFGTWKLQNNTPVPHQGQTIGWKAYLTFYPDEKLKIDPNFLGGSWNMNEYSLPGYQEKEGFVICRVTFRAWTEKERAKRGLEKTPAASSYHIDATARSRKRTKVACGSGNNWGEAEAPCASVSSYVNRDHCSSSSNVSIVEDQSHPFACASSCSDKEINNIAQLEAPCDVSCYSVEANTVAEQPSYACAPSCSNQEINNIAQLEAPCDVSCYNVEASTVAEQPSYACAPSCSNQEINNIAELEAPCDISYYDLETSTVAEQPSYASESSYFNCGDLDHCSSSNVVEEQPTYPYAPCSDQEINKTAVLEGPCDFSCYNLETKIVEEQDHPYVCAPSCSDQEINTTAELEGPCNFSCYNLETNTAAEQPPYAFPWFSNLESCTVVEQPPSPYALSYYDVEESYTNTNIFVVEELQQPEACGGFSSTSNPESNTNTNSFVIEELLQSSPPASGVFPWSSYLLEQQQLSSILSSEPERQSWEDFVVPEYLAVVGELWS